MERLEHENTILHHGSHESTETDLELQTAYHRLSEAEHGWNFTRQQLNLACEEVDTHTHAILHLEDAVEMQDTELDERAETIANLEHQLLEL
jgi:chromosome segregation ATPase